MSVRKFLNHYPLVLTIWGQPIESSKRNTFFDSSLLGVEMCKAMVLKAWERETSKPTRETRWAPCIEVAIQRVMTCNGSFIKKCNCLKGMQVKAHFKKIQLGEVQLQSDLINEHVCAILSESQGKLAELF